MLILSLLRVNVHILNISHNKENHYSLIKHLIYIKIKNYKPRHKAMTG